MSKSWYSRMIADPAGQYKYTTKRKTSEKGKKTCYRSEQKN